MKKDELAGHAACLRKKRVLVWKLEGKRPLRRTSRRRETNVTVGRKKMGWDGMDWMHLAQDAEKWRAVTQFQGSLRRSYVAPTFKRKYLYSLEPATIRKLNAANVRPCNSTWSYLLSK